MKSMLLPIHISFVGIWLGCVITEALFERALIGKGKKEELILVELHKHVDLIVEIPSFVVVLITGIMMYSMEFGSSLLNAKIGLGLLAIAVNVYCVWLVFQRATAATKEKWGEFSRLDEKQHKYGAVVLISIVLALAVGIYIYGKA